MDTPLECLKTVFGHESFRPLQLEMIEAVLEGRDVCGILATGHGKSVCYQIPALCQKVPAVIISPLLSLMEDQRANLEKIGIKACCYNSNVSEKMTMRNEILEGKYSMIYLTPEAATNDSTILFLQNLESNIGLSLIAIDESHCVSLWGNSFRSSYLELRKLRVFFPKVPIMALTGTATPKVAKDIITLLGLRNPITFRASSNRPNLSYFVERKSTPEKDLIPLLDGDPVIIYCQSRKDTEKITDLLQELGVEAGAYHAGMSGDQRNKVYEKFIDGTISTIVATISFGMGIDKADIRKVIHYGCPKDVESYLQETGRAGRDGQPGKCYIFYAPADFNINRFFVRGIEDPIIREHREEMTAAIERYVYLTTCRRKYLLEYFDEKLEGECTGCDNCQNRVRPPSPPMGKPERTLLELISTYPDRFGRIIYINILRGSKSAKIPEDIKKCPYYGQGTTQSAEWWKDCVAKLLVKGYIREKTLRRGFGSTLGVTPQGITWLNSGEGIKVSSFKTLAPPPQLPLRPAKHKSE